MALLSPGNVKPAASVRSVGGMNACAASSVGSPERESTSGGGNRNPWLLSKGSPDRDENLEFHIRFLKNPLLAAIGARRSFLGPRRSGPTIPVLSIPMAIV